MDSTTYLVIGGGLAGGEAAKRIREKDTVAGITLVGDEPHRPYDRPPLSKEYLRGEKPLTQLPFDSEQTFQERQITLVLGVAVNQLDTTAKTARLANGRTIRFEKALFATGGRPIRLQIPGGTLPGVHYLRTIEDATAIAMDAQPGRRVVIIGAGFIGLEVAASLTQRGAEVTVLESQARIWPKFAAPAVAEFVQKYCTEKGVRFLTNETAVRIVGSAGNARAAGVVTRAGHELPCDAVCIGVGIVPNVELAQQAGLEVQNGIVVNEYLETSRPGFYAAGDVANFPDPYAGKRRRVEHWGHAEYSGQLAGQNMAGDRQAYDLLSYVWSDIFDLHLEFAGDESEHDQMVIRGRVEDGRFTVLYLKERALCAYFAMNTGSKDLPTLQKLIKQKKDLSEKLAQLQDASVPIKSLV